MCIACSAQSESNFKPVVGVLQLVIHGSKFSRQLAKLMASWLELEWASWGISQLCNLRMFTVNVALSFTNSICFLAFG